MIWLPLALSVYRLCQSVGPSVRLPAVPLARPSVSLSVSLSVAVAVAVALSLSLSLFRSPSVSLSPSLCLSVEQSACLAPSLKCSSAWGGKRLARSSSQKPLAGRYWPALVGLGPLKIEFAEMMVCTTMAMPAIISEGRPADGRTDGQTDGRMVMDGCSSDSQSGV